jgi:phage/plasmid-like protein (TIGR03299 family)
MSHLITNNRDMAYVGETPWHGLGHVMPAGASIEEWQKQAGLLFTVAKAQVNFDAIIKTPSPIGGELRRVEAMSYKGRKVTFREDTGAGLGIVGDNYKVHQPGEIVSFLRDFASKAGLTIETMGSIMGGARIWALAKMDTAITLPGNDVSMPYFLISTSYNGETATIGTFTMVRVVCYNTLTAALEVYYADGKETDEATDKKRIVTGFNNPHNAEFKPEQAARESARLYKAAVQYGERANLLAATGVSEDQMLEYFLSLYGSISEKTGQLTDQSRAKVDQLVQLYRTGPGAELKSAKGTVWGLLNAVTRYVDHEAGQRAEGGRLNSAWFGTGQDKKREAEKAALALVPERQLVAA